METPQFSRAAVAAPHALAIEAGREALAAGGNAIEAMVAMAAAIAVVYPHMNSLGGDGFWVIRDPAGRLRYIEACGYAGSRASADFYRSAGCDSIPARGPLAALTVPGAIAGWRAALDLAAALGGRLPLKDLLQSARGAAKEGYRVAPAEARSVPREEALLERAPGFCATFRPNGARPKTGEERRPSALGNVLDQLAQAGLDDFYRGDIARELASDMDMLGIPVVRDDLARYAAVWREPLVLRLNGVTLVNSPPPTQGLASLLILGVFDRLGVERAETFEHIHGLIEASKRAIAIRDAVCVDYDCLRGDPAAYLDARVLAREAAHISMDAAAPYPIRPDAGDTVWMGAIDSTGLAVSYIQSIFWEYGSGCVLPRTGVHLQNRGTAFSLDPNSRQFLKPGKRPFHTLNPPLTVFEDGSVMVYGAMGGDGQPQFQAQTFTRIRLGAGLAEAIDRPRFLLGRAWGEQSTTLKLEPRFDSELVRRLARAGHETEILPQPYADACGHAGAVLRRPNGGLEAAHDPRADGGAAGL